jgi:ubiquinone/menaquinone biosynthesis C-methylase UbiE
MENEEIEAVREHTKELASDFIERGDATGWFEALYAEAEGDNEKIPWADLEPNRFLVEWAESVNLKGNGRTALVVGCGLGDDAEFLEDHGFKVTAFDVSPKAIEWAKKIHSKTKIEFFSADLFEAPEEWKKAFDFVLEVYTIQALPLNLREKTIDAISEFVAENGELVIVTRGRQNDEEPEGLPWALSYKDISRFESNGLTQINLTEMLGDEEEPIRRFVAHYKKSV